ncbi:hypothetical protein L2U69_12045 [Zavarzinia compransoris]|uniref:hypothetical protein n=1 Tax=Zavarzinia marina TaxID=2911065 RepID=UPI001F33BBF5|nr:hypothetical protein [Zavarzinia marina]MCF4166378.1 hypothetical protein [Zavarzinia marina]
MTADLPTLRALVSRLEAGEQTGALADGIHGALCPDEYHLQPAVFDALLRASVDGAIAFTEAVLPGWVYGVGIKEDFGATGWVQPPKTAREYPASVADAPATALLQAALKAKIAEMEAT